MTKVTVKEIKGINNHGFYPEHYLTSALQGDAKAFGYNGDPVKEARKIIQPRLDELADKRTAGLAAELAQSWFKILGYYEVPASGDNRLRLSLDLKDLDVLVERLMPFIGSMGLMAIMVDSQGVDDETSAQSEGDSKSLEHFYTRSSPVKFKDGKSSYSWKDVISALFNSDFSTAEWLMISSGDFVYLMERGRWQEANAYLEVDLATLFSVNSDESYQIVDSLFSAKAFPFLSAESFHDRVGRNAHKKAAEVTKALRDTVRESVELLANQVLDGHRVSPIKQLKVFDLEGEDGREEAANLIFDQSLRYVYRMLFMLFTESQDNRKGSLPVHSQAYQLGYAIEKLRNLEHVPFLDDTGNFIQQSLEKAFTIYYSGYRTARDIIRNEGTNRDEVVTNALGFSFPAIGTDLFARDKTSLFNDLILGDRVMQDVLRKLSLAKVGSGKASRTYRVHYAGLGLNQLGAVYEGMLSLKPVVLRERVALLAKEAKDLAYRYVPYSNLKDYDRDLLAVDDSKQILSRKAGSFMLSPVGLERKFSASFYTPEVLTRFVAKEAVEILLEKDATLARMEKVRICEPAMGSGAFLNGVVDELASRMAREYAKIDQDRVKEYRQLCEQSGTKFLNDEAPVHHEMPHYISRAKEHLMTHSVYGVDLNPTAVELAKISLWLNCLHEDGNLPFLDFKLKHGNSLVGAWLKRHAVVVGEKEYPHFFIPNPDSLNPHIDGLVLGRKDMPFVDDAQRARLKSLKTSWQDALGDKSLGQRLDGLLAKVSGLYENHLTVRRAYRESLGRASNADQKKEIFEKFVSEDTAYNQLRSMMDYWCALWFWPQTELSQLPSVDSYLTAMEWFAATPLPYGGPERERKLKESGMKELLVAKDVSVEQCFFHWDIEFAEVFEDGGFDLVLGNPPWAPVRWEDADFFEAVRPGIHAKKADSKVTEGWYLAEIKKQPELVGRYCKAKGKSVGFANFLGNSKTYLFEDNSKTNTYKYFFQRFQQAAKKDGIYALIAQDGILNDPGCTSIRRGALPEIVRLFRFHNERDYFEDVHNNVQFMCAFHQRGKEKHDFQLLDNLLEVSTIDSCRNESFLSPYVGMKDANGDWELRGHPKRIVVIDQQVLRSLALFADGTNWQEATLPIIHGSFELAVLTKLASHGAKIKQAQWKSSTLFNESAAPKAGLIRRMPGKAQAINRAVFTGPNVFVGNPANKVAKPGAKNNKDFSCVDLVKTAPNFYPDSIYQCTDKGLKSKEYLAETPWGTPHNQQYRILSRRMVSTTGARTLSSAIIPPGPSHVDAMCSISFLHPVELVYTSGLFNSLVFDFLARAISGGTLGKGVYEMFPTLNKTQLESPLVSALLVRALRLGSISSYYADLWKAVWRRDFCDVEFNSEFAPKLPYGKLKGSWTFDTCVRDWKQREQVLVETDVIVAQLFGFDKETLLNLYRAQFGVLQKNMQDLPGQRVNPEKDHFPRFQQMSEAYDQLENMFARPEKKAS